MTIVVPLSCQFRKGWSAVSRPQPARRAPGTPPQPWGSSFTSDKLVVTDAHIFEIPGGKKGTKAKHTIDQCPSAGGRLALCRCINLEQNVLHFPKGTKRGEAEYFDYISLTTEGLANEGASTQIAYAERYL